MNTPELKPCPCGCKEMDILCEKDGNIYGVGIGCMNILCDLEPLMSFATTKEEALNLAIEAWNRRWNNVDLRK